MINDIRWLVMDGNMAMVDVDDAGVGLVANYDGQ